MTLSEEQLEWIVREVVRRLRESIDEQSPAQPSGKGRLAIRERLVTVATLQERLDGVAQIEVNCNTIVTPAAVDLLKDRQIQLVRVNATSKPQVS